MKLVNTLLLTILLAAAAIAQQNLQVGQPAPDFQAQALDGKVYSLSELQGKVVVLTFWSTKCEICHSEIPK
ncbi:peroxiredoxin family protein, partial [Escherichia coli]|nr:peroxiredoxin family protein [Escherichia coli]